MDLNWNILMKTNFTRRYIDEQGRVVMPLIYVALQSGLFMDADGISSDIK